MSEPDAVPAAEPAAQPAAPDFAAFEASENAKATGGTWPDPAKVTATELDVETEPVETTTAEPVPATAATTTTDPAYTPPSPTSKRSAKDQAFINERIRQAAADAATATEARIRAEYAAKATPSEPAKPKEPTFEPTRPKPTEADFETYGDFTEALADWKLDQREAKREFDTRQAKDRDAATAAERDFETRVSTWVDRREAFFAAHPQRQARVNAFLDNVVAGSPIGDALMDSEHGVALADYLATHPTEAERIARLGPVSAIRELGRLEATISTTTSASASAGPAAKTVTSAPAPPTTLAARSADPADPVAAAVMRGDYSTFEAEENRRALAAGR
jgi:hypothetical protein